MGLHCVVLPIQMRPTTNMCLAPSQRVTRLSDTVIASESLTPPNDPVSPEQELQHGHHRSRTSTSAPHCLPLRIWSHHTSLLIMQRAEI